MADCQKQFWTHFFNQIFISTLYRQLNMSISSQKHFQSLTDLVSMLSSSLFWLFDGAWSDVGGIPWSELCEPIVSTGDDGLSTTMAGTLGSATFGDEYGAPATLSNWFGELLFCGFSSCEVKSESTVVTGDAVPRSGSFVNFPRRQNTPRFGSQTKYRCDPTLPSFLPVGVSRNTPAQSPAPKWTSPTKAMVPGFVPPTSTRSPTFKWSVTDGGGGELLAATIKTMINFF